MSINDKKPKEIKQQQEEFIEILCHFLYKYIGRNLLRKKKFKKFFYESIYIDKYESILKKANMRIIPEEYFVSIFILIVSSFVFFFIFGIVVQLLNFFIGSIVFYGGFILTVVVGFFLYNYPVSLASTRGDEIDASLPYVLPYMKLLSKELSLAKIIEIINGFLIYKEIRSEFNKINYHTNVLGKDIHSSIRYVMESCPSRALSDTLNDMVTISNSGGNIYKYLSRKLINLNTELEATEKKNIETLLIYSQIYVVVLLIGPLFYTIMSSILGMINLSGAGMGGASSAGGSISSTLMLLVGLPFAYAGFMMLIYYSKPLYSRLQPMKNDK